MKNLILILILSVFASTAFATEIDDTTGYYTPLADSESVLNAKVQELIAEARARHYGCNRHTLMRQASTFLVGGLIYGSVEYFANNSAQVARVQIPVSESIYKGTPYEGSFVDKFVNLGSIVNIAGHHVGTDKMGHFMDMGYDLYNKSLMGHSVTDLLAQSRSEQTGMWGWRMTGVKSYGDIASNFDGYRFWKEFIEEGPNQYLVCENGAFKQVRQFKWSDYISAAWTEAINCSAYSSDKYNSALKLNIGKLEATGRRYSCPIEPNRCDVLRKHYEQWIPPDQIGEIISPLCK